MLHSSTATISNLEGKIAGKTVIVEQLDPPTCADGGGELRRETEAFRISTRLEEAGSIPDKLKDALGEMCTPDGHIYSGVLYYTRGALWVNGDNINSGTQDGCVSIRPRTVLEAVENALLYAGEVDDRFGTTPVKGIILECYPFEWSLGINQGEMSSLFGS